MNAVLNPSLTALAPEFNEGQFTNRHGLSLYFRDYGARDLSLLPVICLPGVSKNTRSYHLLATHLVAQFGRRVLCLDFRGHGRSDYDPDYRRYCWQTHADDVLEWMTYLGVSKAIFIGTSLGGASTLVLAGRRPDLLGGLILNDVGPWVEVEGVRIVVPLIGTSIQYPSFKAVSEGLQKFLNVRYPDLDDASWKRMAYENFKQGADGYVRPDYDPNIGIALREEFARAEELRANNLSDAEWELWPQWERIADVPTLVIRGVTSDILSLETIDRMKKTHRSIEVSEIPHRGHAPLLNEDAAIDAIDKFFLRCP